MESLTKADFVRILRETENNLLLQAIELLKTEHVNIVFEGQCDPERLKASNSVPAVVEGRNKLKPLHSDAS